MVSTGIQSLDQILGDGYPDRSSVLVIGQSGIGKEALAYWFTRSGLVQGDYCLYVTHRPVADVLRDMKAFGISEERVPEWIASSGSAKRCDLRDQTTLSFNIKQAVLQNKGRRVRVVADVLSPLLILNPSEAMYAYWSQLIDELKQHDAVFLALADEATHLPSQVAAMELLFDGVIEMKLFEEGLSITPLLRIKKMLGQAPQHGYFRFSFSHGDLEIVSFVK